MSEMDADFASVWSRVTGGRPAEDELTKLRRWLRDEAEGIRSYETMLRYRLPPHARETLGTLLKTERRHLRQLRTLYYLRTGDSWLPPKPEEQEQPPLMKSLRERYAAVLAQEESYRQAASERRDTAALCESLAGEEAANAAQLRELTRRLLLF